MFRSMGLVNLQSLQPIRKEQKSKTSHQVHITDLSFMPLKMAKRVIRQVLNLIYPNNRPKKNKSMKKTSSMKKKIVMKAKTKTKTSKRTEMKIKTKAIQTIMAIRTKMATVPQKRTEIKTIMRIIRMRQNKNGATQPLNQPQPNQQNGGQPTNGPE